MTGRAPRRGHDDSGVVLVEFALVLPLLMMLLLGTISGASAWNQSQALGQGTRVAGRYAATLPLPATADSTTMAAWLDGVVDRAVSASEGRMTTGVAGRVVCAAYVDPAGTAPDKTFSRTMDAAGTRTSGTTPCFTDGQDDSERRVQVVEERDGYIDVGLYRQSVHMRRTVVYGFEADGGI